MLGQASKWSLFVTAEQLLQRGLQGLTAEVEMMDSAVSRGLAAKMLLQSRAG